MHVEPVEPLRQPDAEYIKQLFDMGASEDTIRRAAGPPRVGCHLYRGRGRYYPQPVAEVLTGRLVAKLRARAGGYFWTPCILCGQEWGGHEWGHDVFDSSGKRLESSVPCEDGPENMSTGICPACTRAGRGYLNPLMLKTFDRQREEYFLAHPELEEPE